MRRLSYTDPSGITYVLNDDLTAHLKRGGLTGFGALRPDIATQQVPGVDGVEVTGVYTGPRTMRVAVDIVADDYDGLLDYVRTMRRSLSLYKDRETPGVLTVEDVGNSVTRSIDCWLTECPDPEYIGPDTAALVYSFWAKVPWFYDPTPASESLAMSGGGVTFPITFPLTFGATGIDSYAYPNNAGDIETWPTIRIQAAGGEDPELENVTTGKAIALSGITLDTGDYVEVNMAAGTVMYYDASAYEAEEDSVIELLTDDSEFWNLRRGSNVVHATLGSATSGSITLAHTAYYQSA